MRYDNVSRERENVCTKWVVLRWTSTEAFVPPLSEFFSIQSISLWLHRNGVEASIIGLYEAVPRIMMEE